jgi:translocator protein
MSFAPSTPAFRPGWGPALRNAAIAAGSVIATAVAGGLATSPKILGWYATLEKPWFNPPNWLFGPAWSVMFLVIAVAFWRVLQTPETTPMRSGAIGLFVLQLVLNALWSVLFFGFESPGLALVEVVPFWLSIFLALLTFTAIDRTAAWLMVPYLAWVTFAGVLNYAVWSLN